MTHSEFAHLLGFKVGDEIYLGPHQGDTWQIVKTTGDFVEALKITENGYFVRSSLTVRLNMVLGWQKVQYNEVSRFIL